MQASLVLDTDIGTDVDDVLALTAILGSPELDLAGVTTVYGDVLLRARMVARLARVAGRSVGPVVPGRGETRSGREVFWAGHEGVLMPDLDRETVDGGGDPIGLLAGSSTVLAIGPLTNLAEAVEVEGRGIEQVFLMGGDFTSGKVEHNIKCDVAAAGVVFGSGVPATVIGLEQTTRLRLDGLMLAELESAGALGELLGGEIRQYWAYRSQDFNVPHDPAAVLMMVEPSLFSFATGRIVVEDDGLTRFSAEEGGPHRIVTDLDPVRVARRIVDRMLAAIS
ncbi:ribonucleoside hydrolase RihC [Kribbella koreensis]|uniref:Ribonucleoside hydrolase RihC n=1 Tax=Kribbella koreensis TaxID=57909 RepID=A0ABN1RPJ6_9ACTN